MTLRDDFNFSQSNWPGAGDVDDCWVVSAYRAVHASAPWLGVQGVVPFRAAAGNPDKPGQTGGSIAQTKQGLKALYPSIASMITGNTTTPWPSFVAALKSGHPAVLFVKNGALPANLRYTSYAGGHALAVSFEAGEFYVANPLAPPHSKPLTITQAALHDAQQAFSGANVECVILPTEAQALATNPAVKTLMASAADKAIATIQATVNTQTGTIAALKTDLAAAKLAVATAAGDAAKVERARLRGLIDPILS